MDKSALREKYRQLRLQLPPGELERLSEVIVEQTLTHFQLSEKTISLFLPIELQKEINTYLLWERARNVGATVAIPKSNFDTMEMRHYLFEHTDQLEINDKGIPEPKKGKIIAADRFDIVFVPLLAADKQGNRVGYGKGFYDRFLRKCSPSCQFIGLHYFDLEDKIEDVLPTDIRLNAIVTPEKVIRFE
ncbi:MAG: 5-formyltetrahydrofolate cyclo-ligase [Fluviicola sp.]|jgi:5-formyltetrahydrofolate cyclo-ligase|nr:5-formyltetrahydrofolate cyclo-ligase [Fluviicola sp.]